jgi:VanZ family protein
VALSRRQKFIIVFLAIYWPCLFILAHISIPQVVREAGVSDKALHFLAYLVLAFMLWSAINPNKKVSWRRATVWWVLIVVAGYGALDELLQSYSTGRTCAIGDLVANLVGVLISLMMLTVLTFWPALLMMVGITIFVLTNLAKANLNDLLPVTNTMFYLLAYGSFTVLWIRYLRFFHPANDSKSKWVTLALTIPMGLLFVAKLGSLVLGRTFEVRDMVLSVAGIVTVVAVALVIALLRDRLAESRNSFSAEGSTGRRRRR